MKCENFLIEINEIQQQIKLINREEFSQRLRCFVEINPWRAILIYGCLYIKEINYPHIKSFFAKKTLETINKVSKQLIDKERKNLLNNNTSEEKTKSQMTARQLDQLLIAMTFLFFTFDNSSFQETIKALNNGIQKKLIQLKKSFIDKIPQNDYLKIIGYHYKRNEKSLKPIKEFFNDLLTSASFDDNSLLKMLTIQLKTDAKRLIAEAGSKLEKPDRLFSYADSLNTVTRCAEELLGHQNKRIKKIFNKYKWIYQQKKGLENLNIFWTVCMIGLYTFSKSVDTHFTLIQLNTKVQVSPKSEKCIKEKESSKIKGFKRRKLILENLFLPKIELGLG